MTTNPKEKRIDIINKISRRKHWDFGDNNPYFVEVWELMPKIDAKSYREYKRKLKLEKEKYEKVAMYNAIRTRLCV